MKQREIHRMFIILLLFNMLHAILKMLNNSDIKWRNLGMLKRIIALFLCMTIVFTMLPMQAFATEAETEATERVVEVTETEATEETTVPADSVEETTEPAKEDTVPLATEVTEDTTMPTEVVTESMEDVTEPTVETLPEEGFEQKPALASSKDVIASGVCGEDVTWALDSEGVLTISGTGSMHDFTNAESAP